VRPAALLEIGQPPSPLGGELGGGEAPDRVAVILRPGLLHRPKERLGLGVNDLRRELAIVLCGLPSGQLDSLFAPAPPPPRDRVQRAEHQLRGAKVLADVQANAGTRLRRALPAQ